MEILVSYGVTRGPHTKQKKNNCPENTTKYWWIAYEGGIVGPEGVVAAKKAGNPRAAMIEEVGGECRDTE